MGIRACVHSTYARLSGWKRPKTCCTQSNVRTQVAWWVKVKNAQILRTYYIHCTRSLTVLLHCRNIFLHPISSQVDLSTIIHLRFFAILWEMLMKRTLRENPFFKDMENMRPTNIQDEAVSSHSVDCTKKHNEFKGFEIALSLLYQLIFINLGYINLPKNLWNHVVVWRFVVVVLPCPAQCRLTWHYSIQLYWGGYLAWRKFLRWQNVDIVY